MESALVLIRCRRVGCERCSALKNRPEKIKMLVQALLVVLQHLRKSLSYDFRKMVPVGSEPFVDISKFLPLGNVKVSCLYLFLIFICEGITKGIKMPH